ncbi:calcium homeostasis modulator protein 2 [Platysternon megacephalum]|uniref:Calcium homeostasis modulator protein 2 n=1 Tax=Platysternon megacephalum TaxID=55544 RepID=A0A4D9ENV2_9SAUR|nr:calcium homeostasis modulator protein 2 [Platysternon megacephalum]
MELLALHTRRRRGALLPEEPGEPERKRVCKSLETVPNESGFCHQLNECAMDYWTMELDSKQKGTTEQFIPQTPKEKPNSMEIKLSVEAELTYDQHRTRRGSRAELALEQYSAFAVLGVSRDQFNSQSNLELQP